MPLLFDFIKRQFLSFPPAQTTSFANRTIIVTGASSGLGLEATRLLASLSATRIILACRSPTKGDAAIAAIRQSHPDSTTTLEVWPLDLLSYASILAFAARATADLPRVDGVILNAGIRTAHYSASPEGHEVSVQTNVISTALLACLLHPKLAATAHAHQNLTTHLSFVGSELYEYAAFKERHVSVAAAGRSAKANERPLFAALDDEATFKKNVADRYPVTKLLIAIFMRQLAELAPVAKTGVVVNVIAPGFCETGLGRQDLHLNAATRALIGAIARKPEVGARTLVYGVSPAVERNMHGAYLPDCKVTPLKGLAGDDGEEARTLRAQVWRELRVMLDEVKGGVTKF